MRKLLLPVDGSEGALHAAQHAAKLAAGGETLELHVLNVQPPIPGDVALFVADKDIEEFHREQAERELAPVEGLLRGAGVPFTRHVAVGRPAEVIALHAREQDVDAIVMGTRGLGAVAGLLLGSVASKVIALVDVPVTLVK